MEVGGFRGFRMALGFGGSAPRSGSDSSTTNSSARREDESSASKSRADSASSSSSSSRGSSHSHSRGRRSHRPFAEELPLDRDAVVSAEPEENEGEAAVDEVREEIICMIFDLPRSTTFYQDFSCAIAAAFPMHGRMYPTSTHVCFYSNVFGRERKILMPYATITEIAMATTLMFQGAIRIKTVASDEYTFTSFWGANRESCFALLTQIHERERGRSSTTEEERSGGEEEEKEEEGTTAAEPPRLPRTVSDGGIVVAPRDISMELLLTDSFEVSVAAFLSAFVWDGAGFGLEQYNACIGTTEMQCGAWSVDSHNGRTRSLQFRVPVDSPIGPKSSRVDVLQCAKTLDSGVVVVESSTRLVDIPYGDYFSVEDRWTVVPQGADRCTLTIELKVVFAKSTFWRSQIEARALSDNKAKWTEWVRMAKQHLVEKQAEGTTPKQRRPAAVADVEEAARAKTMAASSASTSASTSSGRRRRRRALAGAIPTLLLLVLVWMVWRLQETVARLEQRIMVTDHRVAQLQGELAQWRGSERGGVCR